MKEPGFFSRNYDRGIDWYSSLYGESNSPPILVDASTTYALVGIYPETPERITTASPSARFIYLVRHPYRRIESSWMQMRSQGLRVDRDFNRAVLEEPFLIEGSRYWTNLNAYLRHRSAKDVLLLFFDDLIRSPLKTVATNFEFLDVDPDAVVIDISAGRTNPSVGKLHPTRALDAAHSFRHYGVVRSLVPPKLRSKLGRVVKRSLQERPRWDPETLEWARLQLEEESRQLLEYAGRDPSEWTVHPT